MQRFCFCCAVPCEMGANLDAMDGLGKTAAFEAAGSGNVAALEVLAKARGASRPRTSSHPLLDGQAVPTSRS